MAKTCYICGELAVSKEHAPAQCFFPEASAYRKNLVTVYSCRKHNEDTSPDDEYVRNFITMSIGGNNIAFQQFFDKTIESLKESRGLFITTTKDSKRVYIDESGKIKPTLALKLDRERFNKVIRKISYALFYKNNKTTWDRELIVMTEFLREDGMEADEFGELIQKFRPLIGEQQFNGQNPQVFKYNFLPALSHNLHDQILRMVFYEGFELWISPLKDTHGPKL